MKFERTWYELSPYLHCSIGVATILYAPGSLLMKASGLILLAAAMTIIGLRWLYRLDIAQRREIPIDESKYMALITQDLFFDEKPR